jgi:hypothetical protein
MIDPINITQITLICTIYWFLDFNFISKLKYKKMARLYIFNIVNINCCTYEVFRALNCINLKD